MPNVLMPAVVTYLGSPIFEQMSWTDQIRQRLVARLPGLDRTPKGYTLHSASRVALVYCFENGPEFQEIKKLAEGLKADFSLQEVVRFTHVNRSKKELPQWLTQLPDSRFIARKDVNFLGQPEGEALRFCKEPFDLLLNLEVELTTPLMYVIRGAHASMKVGMRPAFRSEDYDVLFEPVPGETRKQRMERMVRFLSTTELR